MPNTDIYQGTLYLDSNGRYCVRAREREITFTCGHPMDIKIGRQWVEGRVEHDHGRGGYYFTSGTGRRNQEGDWTPLREGMAARYVRRNA